MRRNVMRAVLLTALSILFSQFANAAPPYDPTVVDNEIADNWYRTQYHTGDLSDVNCGPTSVYMSMIYADGQLGGQPSVEEIRAEVPGNDGRYYWHNNVHEALDAFGYEHEMHYMEGKSTATITSEIKQLLTDGYVIVACYSTNDVPDASNPSSTRYDQHYTNGFGHFSVIKGWLTKPGSDTEYWVMHDPWTQDSAYYSGTYPDGDPMGKDRYYNMFEHTDSIRTWNDGEQMYAYAAIPGGGDCSINEIDDWYPGVSPSPPAANPEDIQMYADEEVLNMDGDIDGWNWETYQFTVGENATSLNIRVTEDSHQNIKLVVNGETGRDLTFSNPRAGQWSVEVQASGGYNDMNFTLIATVSYPDPPGDVHNLLDTTGTLADYQGETTHSVTAPVSGTMVVMLNTDSSGEDNTTFGATLGGTKSTIYTSRGEYYPMISKPVNAGNHTITIRRIGTCGSKGYQLQVLLFEGDDPPPATPPTASDDSYTVDLDGGSVTLNVLSNDSGDTPLSIDSVGSCRVGSIDNTGSSLRFTPTATGSCTFDYSVSNDAGSDNGSVTVTVEDDTPVPVAPIAKDDSYSVHLSDDSVILNVLSNDSGDSPLSIDSVSSCSVGSVTNNGSDLSFTPSLTGSCTFDYVVSNASGSDTGTVTVKVTEDTPPVVDEIVVDNRDANTYSTGEWGVSSGVGPYGEDSVWNNDGDTFRWMPDVPKAGNYDVYAWWTDHENRTDNVPYRITHGNGTDTVRVDQRDDSLDQQWNFLGTYYFNAGSTQIEISGHSGQACADAIGLVPSEDTPPPPQPVDEIIVDNSDSNTYSTGDWGVSSGVGPYGDNSVWNNDGDTFRWLPDVPLAGTYEVYAWWTDHEKRTDGVPYRITHADGSDTVLVDQRDDSLDQQWNLLGEYYFNEGSAQIEISGHSGQACADAIRLRLKDDPPSPTEDVVQLRNVAKQTYLGVSDSTVMHIADGEAADTWWELVPVSGDNYYLRNVDSDMYLNYVSKHSVTLVSSSGTSSTQWRLLDLGQGSYLVQSVASERNLDCDRDGVVDTSLKTNADKQWNVLY